MLLNRGLLLVSEKIKFASVDKDENCLESECWQSGEIGDSVSPKKLFLELCRCPPVLNRNLETEFGVKEKKIASLALPGKRGHSRLMLYRL